MDDRIRKIKKRKKKKQPIDVTLIIVSLFGSTAGCLLLGLFIPFLRWLILAAGSADLIAGTVLVIHTLYAEDEDLFSDMYASPRSCAAGTLMLMGFLLLIFYVTLAMRGS